jgi:phosphatidate cytidylyltransferase
MRVINGIAGAGFTIWIVLGDWEFLVCLLVGLFLMLYEWTKINRGKKKYLLFYCGIIYIIIPTLFWALEYYNDNAYNGISYNLYTLWVLSIVWACDIFAYFGGKLIGGPKLAPQISPNKTWSGVVVGIIFSMMTSYIYVHNVLNDNIKLFYLSIVIIISAILGDLLESKTKRILNVKDTGNIIPGHGGFCDRLDSFLLATYAFIIIKLMGLL